MFVVTGEYSIEAEIEMVELEFSLISHLDRYHKNSNYLGMYGHLKIHFTLSDFSKHRDTISMIEARLERPRVDAYDQILGNISS